MDRILHLHIKGPFIVNERPFNAVLPVSLQTLEKL